MAVSWFRRIFSSPKETLSLFGDGNHDRAISILKQHVFQYKTMYFIGALSVGLTTLGQALVPKIIGQLIDMFQSLGEAGKKQLSVDYPSQIYYLLAALSIVALGRVLWRLFLLWPTFDSMGALKADLWDKCTRLSYDQFHRKFTLGNILNINTSDTREAGFLFGFSFIGMSDISFMFTFAMIGIGLIDWHFLIVLMLVIPFYPYVIKKISQLEMQRYRSSQESLSDFHDNVAQSISTIRLQRLTQTGKFWTEMLIDDADLYREKRLKAVRTSLYFIPVMGSMAIMFFLIFLILGIYKIQLGTLTVGQLITIHGLIFLLQEPIIEIGYIISEFQRGLVSLDRVYEFLTGKNRKEIRPTARAEKSQFAIDIKNLDFSYEDENGKNQVFAGLDLQLNHGESLGIIGEIGSGKSTLVKLLTHLETASSGKIEIMGRAIDSIPYPELAKHISVVPQKPFLFADTIRENLILDRDDISEDEIWEALELANVKVDVEEFPGGLDTELGEWGINLSGGQKQRLTIARALLRPSDILIFDDCLSAVDTVTEDKILQGLRNKLQNKSLIWIAHRESTLKYCNRRIEFGGTLGGL